MNNIEMVKLLRQETGASFLDCKKAVTLHGRNVEKATAFLREKGLNKATEKLERKTEEGVVVVKTAASAAVAVELACETDFVARNETFKAFAQQLANMMLADATLVDADALLLAALPIAPGKSVKEGIHELVSKFGENIMLRQAARFAVQEGRLVTGYVHAGAIAGYDAAEGRVGVLLELVVDTAVSQDEIIQQLAHNLTLHIASAAPQYVSRAELPMATLQKMEQDLWDEVAEVNKPDAVKAKMVEGRLAKWLQAACLLRQPYLLDESHTVAALLEQAGNALKTNVTVSRFARFELGV
ncbi:MAG: translation elongation factor Ts [Anaerolineaceae bacterium]|nr:translation elongation factor Ts [Anaerolineaceae bacterium]